MTVEAVYGIACGSRLGQGDPPAYVVILIACGHLDGSSGTANVNVSVIASPSVFGVRLGRPCCPASVGCACDPCCHDPSTVSEIGRGGCGDASHDLYCDLCASSHAPSLLNASPRI